MAIIERRVARAKGGRVQAYSIIDDSTDPPKRTGFRIVLPQPYRISGRVDDPSGVIEFSFSAAQIAALPGGVVPLEVPQEAVWDAELDDGEGGWVFPSITWMAV